jgi:hypothetical protein
MASMDGSKGVGQPGPGRWLGIGLRLLATLLFLLLLLALNRCSQPWLPAGRSTVVTPVVEAASARLRVGVRPEGATVYVDGLRSGTTPVSLVLPAGQHDVRVEMDGYAPLLQTVFLTAGADTVVDGDLSPAFVAADLTFTATLLPTQDPTPPQPLPDLTVKQVKIELETGGACDYATTQLGVRVVVENAGDADAGPFVVDVNGARQAVAAGLAAGQTTALWFSGYNRGGENTIVVDAKDQVKERKDNNRLSQMIPVPTLPPTCTPPPPTPPADTATPPPPDTVTPTPPPLVPAAVTVREAEVTIPTYPYALFTSQAWSEAFNMPYDVLDRAAYEASNPSPADAIYRALVLENEYLKLTILPDLGGRIYEVYFKPTGNRETYRNPVLKPSPWGPPEQGWWLAAGGIEWCLPVEEHGYEWGVPWTYKVGQDATGATITLHDTLADERVRAAIAVRLEAGAGHFSIRPRLENPTGAPLALKYWSNAMLAPGGRNAPSADLRFVLPEAVAAVTIHSRGDESLPGPGQRLSWPVYDGLDLSRLGNWNQWLGFFEDPAVGPFVAVYDEGYDEGMVRVFPPDAGMARGVKGFAMGWRDPIAAINWTDDSSGYVEIHGGPASTFDDSVSLPAGGHLQWTEIWYPVAGLGGLRYANDAAALNLTAGDGQVRIGVAVTESWSGDVVLSLDGQEHWRQQVSLVPGTSFKHQVSLVGALPDRGRLALRLEAPDSTVRAEYSADLWLK